MAKFCIFNDRFSSNVGDGVIADCLEHGLARLLPGASLRTIDLDGRTCHAPDSAVRYRTAGARLRSAWHDAPAFVHRALSYYRVDHRFRAHVVDQAAGADAFLLGGGQLITGSTSFFPHRLATIAAVARARGIPLFLYGVGVSDPARWQKAAAAHLDRAFGWGDDDLSVATRDELSAEYWTQAFGGARPAIAPDPGLLAAEVYADAIAARRRPASNEVGIGVISADVVNWFGGKAVKPSLDFFVDAGLALARDRKRPVYFTNGSGEDEAALEALADHVALHYPDLARQARFEQRPATPDALVAIIAGLDALIAHRLHASIVAYALKIPHVGLGWDEKLASFFRSVGRDRYLLGAGGSGGDAARLAVEAMRDGIDPADHQAVIDDAWNALGALADRLRQAGPAANVA